MTTSKSIHRNILEDQSGLANANPQANGAKVMSSPIEHTLQAILALKSRKPVIKLALVELVATGATAEEIAKRHGISAGSISTHAQKLRIPRRRRGRPTFSRPIESHLKILSNHAKYGGAETARRMGFSRQHVHNVIRRWGCNH